MFKEVLETTTKKDFRCVVARWLDTLSEDDCKLVAKAIEEHGVYVTWKASKNYSYTGSESAYYRHWKGQCPCSMSN